MTILVTADRFRPEDGFAAPAHTGRLTARQILSDAAWHTRQEYKHRDRAKAYLDLYKTERAKYEEDQAERHASTAFALESLLQPPVAYWDDPSEVFPQDRRPCRFRDSGCPELLSRTEYRDAFPIPGACQSCCQKQLAAQAEAERNELPGESPAPFYEWLTQPTSRKD